MSDTDVWGQIEKDAAAAASTHVEPGLDAGPNEGHTGTDSNVVDAQVTDVSKEKKSEILMVIGLIAVMGVCSAGYVAWSFYRQLVPASSSQNASSDPSILNEASRGSPVPGLAADALPIPGGGQQAALVAPVVTTTAATPPVAAEPPASQASDVAITVAAPASSAEVEIQQLAATASPPQVAASQGQPAAAKALNRRHAAASGSVSRTRERPGVQANSRAQATMGRVNIAPAPVTEAADGLLTQYRVLAFEPRHGQHQQAWIRGNDGAVAIVRTGDSVNGARVTEISAAAGAVKTTQGEIR